MIVVLADDLSGAAELAGAAARHGLKAEVHTTFDPSAAADVVAVDTDSRGLPREDAAVRVRELATKVVAARPDWIYKKVDSVMRGHIQAELGSLLAVTGAARALLIPANPSRQRIIRDGIYWVEGRELARTAFAQDPEFPARSSRVLDGLRLEEFPPLFSVRRGEPPAPKGISVPDAASQLDLEGRADALDEATLPAGGVDFFEALLRARIPHTDPTESRAPRPVISGATLLVCGSAAAIDGGRLEEARGRGFLVSCMPEEVFAAPGEGDTSSWEAEASEGLRRGGNVMMAVGRPSAMRPAFPPAALIQPLVRTAIGAIRGAGVGRVMVEGGATAVALLRGLGWTRLTAHWAGGQAQFAPHDQPEVQLRIKPGSYPWPEPGWPHAAPCHP